MAADSEDSTNTWSPGRRAWNPVLEPYQCCSSSHQPHPSPATRDKQYTEIQYIRN